MRGFRASSVFEASVPNIHDRYLVRLFFEAPATDIVARLGDMAHGRVPGRAAGAGVLTRALGLPRSEEIVSSDLSRAMLDRAAEVETSCQLWWPRRYASRSRKHQLIKALAYLFRQDHSSRASEPTRLLLLDRIACPEQTNAPDRHGEHPGFETWSGELS